MEETGWVIADPVRLAAYRRFTFMPEYDLWAEKLCLIYMARPVLRRGPPLEADHAVIWASPDAAGRLIDNDGDRFYFRRALGL